MKDFVGYGLATVLVAVAVSIVSFAKLEIDKAEAHIADKKTANYLIYSDVAREATDINESDNCVYFTTVYGNKMKACGSYTIKYK